MASIRSLPTPGLFRVDPASHVARAVGRRLFEGKGHEHNLQVEVFTSFQRHHLAGGLELHGHGAGVVVRADGAGDRVVVGADQDALRGITTKGYFRHYVGDLEAVIVIRFQPHIDPDPLVEIPDIVRRLFEVPRNPNAALPDVDRERLEVASQPGFCLMDIDHIRRPRCLCVSGMRDNACGVRQKKAAECKSNSNDLMDSDLHCFRR